MGADEEATQKRGQQPRATVGRRWKRGLQIDDAAGKRIASRKAPNSIVFRWWWRRGVAGDSSSSDQLLVLLLFNFLLLYVAIIAIQQQQQLL